MRIDFLGLQAFLSIAERGSFQRAAAHLNLSQTAISHRMRKLEDELGIKLFARTTREVTLTRAGIDFLPKAQKAIAELEQSFDELKQQGAKRRDRLDIACLPAFAVNYLPPKTVTTLELDVAPGLLLGWSPLTSAGFAFNIDAAADRAHQSLRIRFSNEGCDPEVATIAPGKLVLEVESVIDRRSILGVSSSGS